MSPGQPEVNPLRAFRHSFAAAQSSEEPAGFGWYPYDSLASFDELLQLRPDRFEQLLASLAGRRILDVGCADGAMSFYLETRGFRLVALDSPDFNFNQMRGVHELKRRFSSPLEIRAVDLERDLLSSDEDFGLAVAMGLLYHLRNPISFLQRLARCSSYCLLSTRVILGDSYANAYLVDATELGADETNYWLFTAAGMERLLTRTGWELMDSRQVTHHGDTRYFCWAKSRLKPAWRALAGLHAPEERGWRWTERQFSVSIVAPAAGCVEIRLVVPEPVWAALGVITASVQLNCGPVTPFALKTAGEHSLRLDAAAGPAEVKVELDRALAPNASDRRELGVVLDDVRWLAV